MSYNLLYDIIVSWWWQCSLSLTDNGKIYLERVQQGGLFVCKCSIDFEVIWMGWSRLAQRCVGSILVRPAD